MCFAPTDSKAMLPAARAAMVAHMRTQPHPWGPPQPACAVVVAEEPVLHPAADEVKPPHVPREAEEHTDCAMHVDPVPVQNIFTEAVVVAKPPVPVQSADPEAVGVAKPRVTLPRRRPVFNAKAAINRLLASARSTPPK